MLSITKAAPVVCFTLEINLHWPTGVHFSAIMAESSGRFPSPMDYCDVVVMHKGRSFPYTIPSFPSLTALLREAKLKWENDQGSEQVFDGFLRECPLLRHPLPAIARVPHGHKNAFFVEVSYVSCT